MYDLRQLTDLGFSLDEARQLRRISMTLHRWHELECGDSNDYQSFSIVRGVKHRKTDFEYADDGQPYMEIHSHRSNDPRPRYTQVADREAGAKRRLARIMAGHPALAAYIQGDPRGCALYILRPGDVPEGKPADSYYSRGIAVSK